MSSPPSTLDVHIGALPPSRWDEIDTIRADANPNAFGDKARPPITSETIDWGSLGITPRWVGEDSREAVVALEPSPFHNHGAQEWDRFLAGAASRGELALAVSLVGSDVEPKYVSLGGARASVLLPGARDSYVGGERLALASPPRPAADLRKADRDLAVRLAGRRPVSLPWWRLELSGNGMTRIGVVGEVRKMEGDLTPLLVSRSGEVVAAVWTSPDRSIRHYILPFMPSYVPVLDWLLWHAVPEFVPAAARRLRNSLAGELELQTAAEKVTAAALVEHEVEFEMRRAALTAERNAASVTADKVRDPLLYGSGGALVAAVARVLNDAGIDVQDLDQMLGGTLSADLLATFAGRSVLVEVKGTSGNAPEKLTEAPARHLRTWPQLRPGIAVSGVVLVINHQTGTHPLDRSPAPYSRREFVTSLPFPVLSTRRLFDWWRTGQHEAVRVALFGSDHAADDRGVDSIQSRFSTDSVGQSASAKPQSGVRGWFRPARRQ